MCRRTMVVFLSFPSSSQSVTCSHIRPTMTLPSPAKRLTPMSSSVRGALSDDEMGVAAGLLARAVHHGQQQQLAMRIMRSIGGKSLAVASQCFMDGIASGSYGAMSDGSKRQRDEDESDWGLLSEIHTEGADSPTTAYYANTVNPCPPMPGSSASAMSMPGDNMNNKHVLFRNGEDLKVPLPSDVPSVEDWAKTVIKLPKLAKYNMTYEEFLIKAEGDTELSSYGEFMLANFGPYAKTQKAKSHTQGVDFAQFLARVKFNGSGMSQGTFRRVTRD